MVPLSQDTNEKPANTTTWNTARSCCSTSLLRQKWSRIKSVWLQSSSQQNPAHYFFYNRLMDYWHNLAIVSGQYRSSHAKLQKGEIIVRDSLHRLVYVCKMCHNPGHTSAQCNIPMEYWSRSRNVMCAIIILDTLSSKRMYIFIVDAIYTW